MEWEGQVGCGGERWKRYTGRGEQWLPTTSRCECGMQCCQCGRGSKQ